MIKGMTFINVGTGNEYQILAHEEDIDIEVQYSSFLRFYELKSDVRYDNPQDMDRELISVKGSKFSESLNKKFVYWLKKNGWVEIKTHRVCMFNGDITDEG